MDAADPIIIENLSGIIIDMNRQAEKEYGWKRDELIGKSIRSLIPPEQYSWADRLRERCRRREEVRNWESIRQDQKGRIFSVLLTAFQCATKCAIGLGGSIMASLERHSSGV